MNGAELILCCVLAFCRCYAFLVVFRALRAYVRQTGIVALSSALTLSIVPYLMSHPPQSVLGLGLIEAVCLAIREIFIGVLLAAPAALVAEVLPTAGRVGDAARGAQLGEQLNPVVGERMSPAENAAVLLSLVLVFSLGAHRLILTALYESLTLPGFELGSLSWLSAGASAVLNPLRLIRVSAEVIELGVLIAAPVIIVSFVFDLAGALMCRALGRINTSFELLGFKLVLGLLVWALVFVSRPWNFEDFWRITL